MRVVPEEVKAAMQLRLDEVQEQMREMGCTEVAADGCLSWTFEDVVGDWNISVGLVRAVEQRGDKLLVPLVCQARKGRGILGHRGNTVYRTVDLSCG